MRLGIKLVFAASIALAPLTGCIAHAQDDLTTTLQRLDVAARNFRSTSADVEFDTTQTDPIPDKEVQKGVVYYERKGGSFEMGVHFTEDNGKPVPKIMVVSAGVFQLYEPLLDQVTKSTKVSKYESYLALGFGASGKDLAAKWNIKYMGPETIDGFKTVKLELVAKDPEVLKLFPKVTIWIDPDQGVSRKQIFDEGQGQTRLSLYSNIKVNKSLPSDAFSFKTDSKTQYVNR
jgi:outer membrane lipoprotein-sorting protein